MKLTSSGGRNRLRVFEKRVLRRTFGLKREEVTVRWRKSHNEELHHNSCSSASNIRDDIIKVHEVGRDM
jgi:hypothetical protein